MKRLAGFCALAALSASAAMAGGFWISTNSTAAGSEAAAVVQVLGCHKPADATVTGTIEGLVNGHRESMPLALKPSDRPGVYLIGKQKLPEGKWVLAVTATLEGMVTSEVVPLGPAGEIQPGYRGQMPDKPGKFMHRKIARADLDAVLAETYSKR